MNRSCLLLLLALAAPASADDAVVFRCTAADGKVTVQDAPCPSGSAQIIQRRGASATSTVSTALGDTAPATAGVLDSSLLPALQAGPGEGADSILDSDVLRAQAAASAADAPPKPPLPTIFRCIGNDGSHYLHEREPAPARCAPLALTGLGGSSAPGNAASCEVVRDTCSELAEEQRCGAWQQHFRDARGRERFAAPETQAGATAERERLQAVLQASDCPVP